MRRRITCMTMLVGMGIVFMPQLGRGADTDGELSLEKLQAFDKRGWFTPAFKAQVHDFVDTVEALKTTKADEKKWNGQLPDLQKQAAAAHAKAAALRQDLAKFDHPEEVDFAALQASLKDASAKLQDQLVLAQAFVWSYPASPHLPEVQQNLQDVKNKIADQIQAEKDAEAARQAAWAKLVQRAQAHDLSLSEWRGFLNDMSQGDLLKYLGRPDYGNTEYWAYFGDWTKDPISQKKSGLRINFNGTRVLSVTELPNP